MGQTNLKVRTLGDYDNRISDTISIETELMPSSLKELLGSHNEGDNWEQGQSDASILSIDKSKEVGTIVGTVDVTETGSANYVIPIEVPKGIAGLEPSVSIAYNSQFANGLMGYGWNVAAFSAISRCGKSYYYDNITEAPQLSNSDNLMLDGQRLLLISGQNLVNGAKYRMEYDPFTDITYKTVNSILCFVVRTKDGMTKVFGSTSDSNIETPSGNTLFWVLSKVTDKNGNTMNYKYDEIVNNGEFYLTKIEYAGNRSIEFTYETRSDKQKTYFAGAQINNNKILKSISTYISQTRIRQYQFNYTYDGFYSKLMELIEVGQNNKQYNSTVINYGSSETQQNEYFSSLSQKREGNKPLFADFNGDGKADFLSYPEKDSYTTSDVATLFIAQKVYGSVDFVKKCTIPIQSSSGVFQGFVLADLNGDGCVDVVNISKALNGTYRYNYYMYDGEKLTYDYKGFNTDSNEAIVGDFNGDGKQELLIVNNQKVFDGDGKEIASGGIDDWGSEYIENYYPNNRYLCDFNGNGKANILVMNASGGWVYELNGRTFVRLSTFNTSEVKNYYFPYFGDFNGDGYTDILVQNYTSGNFDDVFILFSTGKGFTKQKILNADIKAKVRVADFNRDGKSDIFHMEVVNNSVRMKVGTFNGLNFTTAYYSTSLTPSQIFVPDEYDNYLLQVEDFDGDGRGEFCCARYVDSYIIHSFTDNQTLLTKTITNGLGAHISFQYAPITEESVCSSSGNNTSYPISGNRVPLYVVTNVAQNANGYSENIYYRYKNPRIHLQGKGFLGFGSIEAENYNKDRKITTLYGYNEYYYPFIQEQKTTTRAGANISTSVYENSYVYQGNKRVTPYVKKLTETDHLTSIVKTADCTSTDSWGNPLTVITKYGNDLTETVTNTYLNSGTESVWIFSLPLSQTKRITRGSESWIEKHTFEYNARYLLGKSVEYTSDGTKKVLENIFEYDTFGNTTKKTVKNYASSNGLVTKYEYSSDGVSLTKEVDPLLLETTWKYNLLGQIVSSTDPLKKTTTYEYDNMGELVKTIYPDNTFSTTILTWSDLPTNTVYCITENSSGNPVTKKYYDAFERELRNSIIEFDGSERKYDKKYDNAGRISQVSLPFKGSSATKWNIYNYDTYGRLIGLAYASGKSDSYSYSGTSITLTKNGVSSEQKYNSKGELVSVSDPAGKITYNLRPNGQLSSVVAPGDIVTTFEYDEYGRKKAIVDPSAGRKTFSYDEAGNLKEEIDANNRKKIFSYDAYGRITSKEFQNEFKTTYIYENDLLSSVTSTNGTSHTYQYDSNMYGRLVKERDNGPDGMWLEKTYLYSSGNLSSINFTSQAGAIGTESYVYSNGHRSEIKFGGTSVWKLSAENDMGQPVSVITGPVTRSYSFDEYGIPTGRMTTASNNRKLQNDTYAFNRSNGNLTTRIDNTRELSENFAYDNLNRLTRFAGGVVMYDIKGNITQKEDVGNLFYYNTPNKPYAVSKVDASRKNAIPPRSQAVSYTSFERPSTITENGNEALFIYDLAGDRKKMQLKYSGNIQLERYYLGDRYEADYKNSLDKQILYIGGDAYSAPAAYVNQGNSWALYYICRDYLGSITHVINSSGAVIQENSFDAWGRLRDPVTRVAYLPGQEPTLFLGRGYTGHEHLSQFGLINMNARLYDPAIGRFLSPDPFVQMPDFSQNFNRYSYCLNNPLVYVDEDGEIFWFIVGGAAFIGAITNVATHWKEIKAVGGWKGFWKGTGYFVVGGVAAGAGAAAGVAAAVGFGGMMSVTAAQMAAASTGFIPGATIGAAGGATSGFVLNTGNSLMDGERFGGALQSGLMGGITGGVFGGLTGGLIGGAQALQHGRDFWTGKATNRGLMPTNTTSTIKNNVGEGKVIPKDENTYSVYQGLDKEGNTKYVGITKRDPEIRFSEHLNSGTNRADLDYSIIKGTGNLNKTDARIWEQNLINKYGLQKDGGTLYNKINSISPKYWKQYNIKKP